MDNNFQLLNKLTQKYLPRKWCDVSDEINTNPGPIIKIISSKLKITVEKINENITLKIKIEYISELKLIDIGKIFTDNVKNIIISLKNTKYLYENIKYINTYINFDNLPINLQSLIFIFPEYCSTNNSDGYLNFLFHKFKLPFGSKIQILIKSELYDTDFNDNVNNLTLTNIKNNTQYKVGISNKKIICNYV